jgi:hypothetical protein
MFETLYEDLPRLEQFMGAMRGISMGNFQALAEKFDFSKYNTLCDVGGATGLLATLVAKQHPHLRCISFDLPAVEPIAKKWIAKASLADRVRAVSGDFLKDRLPKADVITMGMILHDWNLEKKKHLVRLAYEALPKDGVFIAVENLIDDARRENAFGLLMSLNMLIEFGDAFDFTAGTLGLVSQELQQRSLHLAGPAPAIAYKYAVRHWHGRYLTMRLASLYSPVSHLRILRSIRSARLPSTFDVGNALNGSSGQLCFG